MPLTLLKSFVYLLLSSIRSYRLVTRVFCTMSLMIGFVSASQVMAECTLNSAFYWICSGTIHNETIIGGNSGNQWEFLNGTIGHLTIVAGTGSNVQLLDFSAFTSNITINLRATELQTVATGLQIVLQNFNTDGLSLGVVGGEGADTITGTDGDDSLYGGLGNDTINGGAGEDDLFGGEGADDIYGGEGQDGISGENGNDNLYGEADADIIQGGAGDDSIDGGIDGDTLNGAAGDDSIDGGMGEDTLYGAAGDDTLSGGPGNDWIYGGDGLEDTLAEVTSADCESIVVVEVEIDECLDRPEVVVIESMPLTPELCITHGTRVALENNLLLIFSDFRDTPNGMTISHIPVSSLRAPSDEEKASGVPVLLAYKDSEFAPGWSVAVYWQADHYGFVIYTDNGKNVYDDTGAICGWF